MNKIKKQDYLRYLLEPNYRRYVKGYGFLSYAKIFGDKYCKKLKNTPAKIGIHAAKKLGDKYSKLMDTAKKRMD